nr:dipeptidase 1-like isoform X3 [Onthophagus taurus]
MIIFYIDEVPLIDGHNDLPNNLFEKLGNEITNFEFDKDLRKDVRFGRQKCDYCYTDLPRLRRGKVGGQFFVAYVPCESQYRDAVAKTLEQIDVIKRLVFKYPNHLQLVTSVAGIWDAFNKSKLACLISVEGGHSIDSRLSILRTYYELGVRYLTLTHACSTPWLFIYVYFLISNINNYFFRADNSWELHPIKNLTKFGEMIVKEMNRLGMLVDLSHVSPPVMERAIRISKAPVIFSHSAAYSLCPHNRNVPDKILRMLKLNNGIIMIVFHNEFVTPNVLEATLGDVARQINYVVNLIGINHVGIGADYDGVPFMPKGLEDVSKYPDLFDYLKKRNPRRWTSENLKKLAGLNFLRVLRTAERIRDRLRGQNAYENHIQKYDLQKIGPLAFRCRTA